MGWRTSAYILRHQDAGGADGLQPERDLRNPEAHRIEPHDDHPAAEEQHQADHENPVPGRLLALHRRGHPLRQQRRIVHIEPGTDDDAAQAKLDQVHKGLRPPRRSGRHQQQDRHEGDPDRGLDGEACEHAASR
jgi:hypothetical protein